AVDALSVLGMYLCLVQCSPRRTAVFLSVGFAFGTAVWSTNSRSLYQHGPSLLFLTMAIAALLTRRRSLVGLAGLLLGLAVYVLRKRLGPPLMPHLFAASALTYALYCLWPDWIGGHTYGYRFSDRCHACVDARDCDLLGASGGTAARCARRLLLRAAHVNL